MRIYIYYILGTLAGFLYTLAAYPADKKVERLSKLQVLIDNSLAYDKETPIDSVILWEKELGPQLEKEKQYNQLFQIELLAINAYTTRGDFSIAVDKAHTMYEKAKSIDNEEGITLSLRAIGNAYLGANMYQQAIDAYEEALHTLKNRNETEQLEVEILPNLILSLLATNKIQKGDNYLKRLEDLFDKYPSTSNLFFLSICHSYYYMKLNEPEKAYSYLKEAKKAHGRNNFLYTHSILNHILASYYEMTQQYDLAVKQCDNILKEISTFYAPSQEILMNRKKAELLTLQGKADEACLIYQKANAMQDSLESISYVRQINEFRTLYQIDQLDIKNQQERNKTIMGYIIVILCFMALVTVLIWYVRKKNRCLRRSKTELEKAQKYAENSILTKSLFLSNMSHEIRTPLNALSGFSGILTDPSIDNETRQQCNEIIQQNSELLLKLINDVIDLSSLEVGKLTFKFKKCDAVVICRNVVDTVNKVKQTQAEVYFVTDLETLPLTTDNSRLQQVLINVLINATKFTSAGSITLEMKKVSDEVVQFSVTDTGCGIPLAKQGQIFNRFEKLNEGAQGTGLGLSICQLIIEQLGGQIWIDSEYTKGARFLFTHPITPDTATKDKTE